MMLILRKSMSTHGPIPYFSLLDFTLVVVDNSWQTVMVMTGAENPGLRRKEQQERM